MLVHCRKPGPATRGLRGFQRTQHAHKLVLRVAPAYSTSTSGSLFSGTTPFIHLLGIADVRSPPCIAGAVHDRLVAACVPAEARVARISHCLLPGAFSEPSALPRSASHACTALCSPPPHEVSCLGLLPEIERHALVLGVAYKRPEVALAGACTYIRLRSG